MGQAVQSMFVVTLKLYQTKLHSSISFRKVKSISFPFHFVLSENNLKIISTQLPEKWQMLVLCSRNTSPKNSVLRLHKAQHRN